MNDFDALLGELRGLAKAMPAPEGDAKVVAAAKEGGVDTSKAAGDEDETDSKAKADDDDEMMGKSFAVTLEDGSKVEAFDGTAMMKALTVELETVRTEHATQAVQLEATQGQLAKSLEASAGLFGLLKSQGELIKALNAKVDSFGASGRGRTAALTIMDRPSGTVAAPVAAAAPSTADIMAKAMTAHAEGRASSMDIARIESWTGRGIALPPDLAALVA